MYWIPAEAGAVHNGGAMAFRLKQLPGDLLMMWFFGRDDESLHVEMRYDRKSREFFLLIDEPSGDRHERFSTLASCRLRLVELENQLTTGRWVRSHRGMHLA
jgi:hypothetical protein